MLRRALAALTLSAATVGAIDACNAETRHIQPPQPWFNYTIPPYNASSSAPTLPAKYVAKMQDKLEEFLADMLANYPPENDKTLEEGVGHAYANLRLYKNTHNVTHLNNAKLYIDAALAATGPPQYHYVGALTWPAVYTTASIIYTLLEENPQQVQEWHAAVALAFTQVDETVDCTYLAGAPGLLYFSTVLESFFGRPVVPRASVVRVGRLLFTIGEAHAKANGTTPYLQWPLGAKDTGFLGMASGWGGPLYALLQIPELLHDAEIKARLQYSVDFYVSQLNPVTGKFWSAYPNRVQWCHGSPGVIQIFGQAYQVFGKLAYLKAAELAAEYTASHGLIEKGFQLVHGVSGNIYLVLDLFRRTGNNKWLYYAYQMQQLALDNPQLVDLNGKAIAYDCIPGSAIASTYAAIPAWSDILANLDNPTQSFCPFIGNHW
jgi:hypothetical protein